MTNKFEKDKKDFLDARRLLLEKYGRDYMSAMSKLNARNIYDEDGFLNSDLVLTDKEKKNLMAINPELAEVFKKR